MSFIFFGCNVANYSTSSRSILLCSYHNAFTQCLRAYNAYFLPRFGKLLKELKERIENVIVCIGSVSPPPPSIIVSESIEGYESKEEKVKSLTSMTLEGVIEEVENWCYSLSYAIDADDTRLSNQVTKHLTRTTDM